jgi:7-carboxy-7-deazaguanine synthase
VKFTIASRADYLEAKQRYEQMDFGIPVYAGVVWDLPELTTEVLCSWMIEDQLPWSLNVQVHKFIWDPNKKGV